MSDQVPSGYLDELQQRDLRFQALAESIALETDLRDNVTIRALMKAVRDDAEQAMRDIVRISPMDHKEISLQLVKITTLVYIRDTLDKIMMRGNLAEQAIRAEDDTDDS